ncbi:MAG: hypothetical protein ACT6RD_14355 [Brevundimonas sp.]|uniref:hypothetical protein n=1 Tax=Brevundimonas sp. TaxID=1871086 RepID=UPI0040340A18
MTPSTEPEDDAPIPPAWWLAARREDDDRHAGPSEQQAPGDVESRAFTAPLISPGRRL